MRCTSASFSIWARCAACASARLRAAANCAFWSGVCSAGAGSACACSFSPSAAVSGAGSATASAPCSFSPAGVVSTSPVPVIISSIFRFLSGFLRCSMRNLGIIKPPFRVAASLLALGSQVAAGLNGRLLSAVALVDRSFDVHAAGVLDLADIACFTLHFFTSFMTFLYRGHWGFLQISTYLPPSPSLDGSHTTLVSILHTGHTINHLSSLL